MIGGRLEAFFTVPSSVTVSATNSGGGPTSVPLTAGSYTTTSYCVMLAAQLNAVRTGTTWAVSVSTGSAGTGLVTITTTGTWALTFTTATAGTIIGFVGNIASGAVPVTGTQNARGLWLPNCPATLEGDPVRAPKVTDLRATEGPTGTVISYKSTSMRVHKLLRYSHVARARIWEGSAATTYASLQQWLDDSQNGDGGHTWFSVGSAFQAYWDNAGTDAIVGADLNGGSGPSAGWNFAPAIDDIGNVVKRVDAAWLGMWSVEFPRLVAVG